LTLPERHRYDAPDGPVSFLDALLGPGPLMRVPLRCRFLGGILFAALAPGLLSCGGPCGKERERTLESLSGARSARADAYAPNTYEKAAGLADKADAECRRQERRFLPMRSYSRALGLHSEARGAAEKAANEGSINEGLARQEAFNSRYVAIESVENARVCVVRARKARGGAAGGNLMDRWSRLHQALTELQGRIDRADYLSARDLGERIVRESVRIQAAANRGDLDLPPPAPGEDGLY